MAPWSPPAASTGRRRSLGRHSGDRLATLAGQNAEVTAVAFAPGGKLLATGDEARRLPAMAIRPRDCASGKEAEWLRGHSRTITSLTFVDDGARLITSSGDNTCGQWDVVAGKEIRDRRPEAS